jgi:hypothetical protein
MRAKNLIFVHYNMRVTRKVKRVDYEAEAFEWDPVEAVLPQASSTLPQ